MRRHLVIACLTLLLFPGICAAQSLEEAIATHELEVAAAREVVIQEWQTLLADSLAKNDQVEAGEHRDWGEYFRVEGAMFMPKRKAEMANVYKTYGGSIKSAGDKLRRAYLDEIDRLKTAGLTDDADALLLDLAELRLPAKLASLQPYRSTNWVIHKGFRLYSSSAVAPGAKMNATFELTAGLSSPGLISLRPCNFPHRYVSHLNFRVHLSAETPDAAWKRHATWLQTRGLANEKTGISFQAVTHPDRYIRIRENGEVWLDKFEETPIFRQQATFIMKPARFALWPSSENNDQK